MAVRGDGAIRHTSPMSQSRRKAKKEIYREKKTLAKSNEISKKKKNSVENSRGLDDILHIDVEVEHERLWTTVRIA